MATAQRSNELESTLLWITTGYRVFAALWLSILGGVVLASTTTEVESPALVVVTIVAVLLWSALATAVRVRRPRLLSTWWFVGIDLAIGAWTVVAGTIAGTIQFAGGYPLAGAFGAIYAFGSAGGVIGAATLTAAGLIPVLSREGQAFSQDVANAIAFLFSVGAAAGVAAALRNSDHRRAAAEAALALERTERARVEERAEFAAHLHDSVLQTLALIQRDPAATPDIRGLARHQERELRAWLFPDSDATGSSAGGFREDLVAACSEIEDTGSLQIELVVVGNTAAPVDPIVRAAREAILNARKHAGVESISVYGEATDAEVLIFVKDRGAGFDPDTVDVSRHGVRDSIVGRMERHGGSAEIISTPGSGTEVRLRLPNTLIGSP
jgi:signal transduction histidine kinase